MREAHTGLISPLSIRNTKTCRFFTKEFKLGYPRGVICPSFLPSEYLFLRPQKLFMLQVKICLPLPRGELGRCYQKSRMQKRDSEAVKRRGP